MLRSPLIQSPLGSPLVLTLSVERSQKIFISTRKISPFYGKTCNLLSKVQKRMKQNDFWSRGKIGTKVRNFFLKSQNFPAQIPNRQKENAKGHKKVQTCDFPQINAKKTQKVSELPPGDGFLLPSQKGGGVSRTPTSKRLALSSALQCLHQLPHRNNPAVPRPVCTPGEFLFADPPAAV